MTTEISYGQGAATEAQLRLVPDLNPSMRVIELGVDQTLNPVAFAVFGARTIAVDPDPSKIKELRVAAQLADVLIECHTAEYADLGFVTTGSIDLVVSNPSLADVDDLGRTLRQANRVLKNNRPFIIAVRHPFAPPTQHLGSNPDNGALNPPARPNRPSSIGDWFTQLARTNFRVDQIIEFGDSGREGIPANLIMRARKEGD